MKKIIRLLIEYRQVLSYLFFGVCTTLVNISVYGFCYNILLFSNVTSTAIAWIFAVIFAFFTNKLWVFESKSFSGKLFLQEAISFFTCRIATGILDITIMYITVDIMNLNGNIWKLISNILIIIINYLASKLVIFKKH